MKSEILFRNYFYAVTPIGSGIFKSNSIKIKSFLIYWKILYQILLFIFFLNENNPWKYGVHEEDLY